RTRSSPELPHLASMFLSSVRCQRRAWHTLPDRCVQTPALFFRLRTILTKTTASNFSGTTATNLMTRSKNRSSSSFLRVRSTPCILRELGADVAVAHNEPNGMNINDGCGSTHPNEIQRLVKLADADIGITHDGDADRVLLCDENGEIVDGDEILAIAALDLLN